MNRNQILTLPEVAERLSLSPSEIRRRIRRRDIDALNVGGHGTGTRYRVTETALTAYIRTLAA